MRNAVCKRAKMNPGVKKYLYKLESYINSLVDGRSAKIISAIDSVLIFLVLAIIAGTQTATGYEISIYDVYPWYFWLMISILPASPLIAIILEKKTGQTQFTYLNLTIFYALLSFIVMLSLPAFAGIHSMEQGTRILTWD